MRISACGAGLSPAALWSVLLVLSLPHALAIGGSSPRAQLRAPSLATQKSASKDHPGVSSSYASADKASLHGRVYQLEGELAVAMSEQLLKRTRVASLHISVTAEPLPKTQGTPVQQQTEKKESPADTAQTTSSLAKGNDFANADRLAGEERWCGRLVSTDIRPLGASIDLEKVTRIALNPLDKPFRIGRRHRIGCVSGKDPVDSLALLPRCPRLSSCAAELTSSNYIPAETPPLGTKMLESGTTDVCSPFGLSDPPGGTLIHPPSNCHAWMGLTEEQLEKEKETHRNSSEVIEWCASRPHAMMLNPVAFTVYRLQQTYVSGEALVFNESRLFLRLGCQDGSHYAIPMKVPAAENVTRVGTVVNWSYRQGSNFYHGLIEALPALMALAPILRENNSIPILGIWNQFSFYYNLLMPLVGVPMENLTRYEIKSKEIYHADAIYQPVYQICGEPSRALWDFIRRRYFLHPQGLPLYHPNWEPRSTKALSDQEMARLPPDWVVVVGKRPGKKRAVLGMDEVYSAIQRRFGESRVVLFMGELSIMQARELFRRTRLYVGGHGAALSNMVFMPSGASLVEIRPDRMPQGCYHMLAAACSINYSVAFGHGDGKGPTIIDPAKVMEQVERVAQTFTDLS